MNRVLEADDESDLLIWQSTGGHRIVFVLKIHSNCPSSAYKGSVTIFPQKKDKKTFFLGSSGQQILLPLQLARVDKSYEGHFYGKTKNP